MLPQLLTNRNNNDTGSNHNEEEHNDEEQPKMEKSKESSSMDAEILKGIQAQIYIPNPKGWTEKSRGSPSLPLGMGLTYPPKFKPPTLHSYDVKSSPNQHIYYFRSQTGNVVGNDAIKARLFIGTFKEMAFD